MSRFIRYGKWCKKKSGKIQSYSCCKCHQRKGYGGSQTETTDVRLVFIVTFNINIRICIGTCGVMVNVHQAEAHKDFAIYLQTSRWVYLCTRSSNLKEPIIILRLYYCKKNITHWLTSDLEETHGMVFLGVLKYTIPLLLSTLIFRWRRRHSGARACQKIPPIK